MKNYLLLALVLVSFKSSGQIYHHLIETNKDWQILTIDYTELCEISYGRDYFLNGDDTLINGVSYYKSYFYTISNGSSVFCPPVTVDHSIYYLSDNFIREDTIGKKVYKYNNSNSSDDLLFDFSLSDADTFFYGPAGIGQSYLVVDSVRPYTLLDGEIRNKFFLSDGEFYIESVGSRGFFNGFGQGVYDALVCLTENQVQLYSAQAAQINFGCSPVMGIEDINKTNTNIVVFSNSNILIFNNLPKNRNELKYLVFNSVGQLLQDGNLSEKNDINIKSLVNGIYEVCLIYNDRIIYSSKFVNINN